MTTNMDKTPKDPEQLHEIANNMTMRTEPAWVNPGTPEAALVNYADMPKAQVQGANNDTLRGQLIK